MAPTATEFYYYCPSEVLSTGAVDAASLDVYVTEHPSDPVLSNLGDFLLETGRDNYDLVFASYMASPSSQPLHALCTDIVHSSQVLNVTEMGSGGFVNLFSYVKLGIVQSDNLRNASSSTAYMLRHFTEGDRVLVQEYGDPIGATEVTIRRVTTEGLDFNSPFLNDTLLLVTSVRVVDVARVNAVVAFRQFTEFTTAGVDADASTFNPNLYLLLYRSIQPDIASMTAEQMYLDYSLNPGRIGCPADLQRVLDLPNVENLTITGLLKFDQYAAMQMGDAVVRHIVRKADMLNGNKATDNSLITSAAAKHMIDSVFVSYGSHFESDAVQALSLDVPGCMSANASGVIVQVPLTTGSVTVSGDLTFTSAIGSDIKVGDIAASTICGGRIESETFVSRRAEVQDLESRTLLSANVSTNSLAVNGAASLQSVDATSVRCVDSSFGTTMTHSLDSVVSNIGDARSCSLAVSGPIDADTAQVRGRLASSELLVGSSFEVSNAECIIRTPVSVNAGLKAADIETTSLQADDILGRSVRSERIETTRFVTNGARIEEAEIRRIVGGLNLFGDTYLENLECSGEFTGTRIRATSASLEGLVCTEEAALSKLRVDDDAHFAKNLEAMRVETRELYVPGSVAANKLAVTGDTWLHSLGVARDCDVGGRFKVFGDSNLGNVSSRGSIAVEGSFSANKGTFAGGLGVEWGNLTVSRGSLGVAGNVTAGGFAAFKGSVSTDGALNVGSIACRGDANIGGSTRIGGSLECGDLVASNTRLGNVAAFDATFQSLKLAEGCEIECDAHFDGSLYTEGSINAKGGIVAGGNVALIADVTIGQDLVVERDGEFAGGGTFGGSVSIAGDMEVAGSGKVSDLCVSDGLDCASLDVSTDVNVGGSVAIAEEISIGGNAAIEEDLTVLGAIEGQALRIEETVDVGTDVKVGGELELQGSLRVNEDAVVVGSMSVGQGVRASGPLQCTDITANDIIAGDIACDRMSATAELSCLSLKTELLAASSTDINGTLAAHDMKIDGAATFDGTVSFKSAIHFGQEQVDFQSKVTAPLLEADTVNASEIHVRRIGILPSDADMTTSNETTINLMAQRISALEAQVAILLSRLG